MSITIDKQELLRRLHTGYDQFRQLLAPLTAEQLHLPGVVGDWSAKDLVAHLIAHEQFAVQEITAARHGHAPPQPVADLDEMNRTAVAQSAGSPAETVLDAWAASFKQVVLLVQSLSDAEFAVDGPLAHTLQDTIDGALGNNSYAHYAEHMDALLAWRNRLTSA